MANSKPWFLIMTPADANQPGSQWKRENAASQGKISVRPASTEGWLALAFFLMIWTVGPLLILAVGYIGGGLSLETAIIATVVFEFAIIAVFVLLVWVKSTRLNV